MGDPNKILAADNTYLAVTNIAGTANKQQQLQGVPLGTSDGSSTGAVGVKIVGAGTGGAINVVSVPQTVTLHTALLGASATQAIPTGAKGYLVSILTGTATVNTTASCPAGLFLSDSNTLAAGFSVVTDSASSAFVAWNT